MAQSSKSPSRGPQKDDQALGRPKSSSSRQQRYKGQTQQTGSSALDAQGRKTKK